MTNLESWDSLVSNYTPTHNDVKWEEEKHPRGAGGRFGSGTGSGTTPTPGDHPKPGPEQAYEHELSDFNELGRQFAKSRGAGHSAFLDTSAATDVSPAPSPTSALTSELTVPPPPGKVFAPDPSHDSNGDGITDTARVGVPGNVVPPPPAVGRLPNLTPHERAVESDFRNAFHADPDGMATTFRQAMVDRAKAKGEPPTFGTDDAKQLHPAWDSPDLSPEKRAVNRATLNCALHQTANAITKRAFLQHLDTLKAGDEVMVTVGGCGCHAMDTRIMMADGSIKFVQDIEVGDSLMGPDSTPRRVMRLIRGHGKMYRVIPTKGVPFIVNEDHVLSLQTKRAEGRRGKVTTVNMTVRDFLNKGKGFRNSTYLYRVGVEFPYNPVPLDPYFLGIWLGNGTHTHPRITTPDGEIVEYLEEFKEQFPGLCLVEREKDGLDGRENKARDYALVFSGGKGSMLGRLKGTPNPVTELLRLLGVLGNKHIPRCYMTNDRNTRLRLLAGLLDTDGTVDKAGFGFSTKSEQMAYDVAYLARSLGFAAYVGSRWVKTDFIDEPRQYWGVSINGEVDEIPTRVPRKQPRKRIINKDPLRVGFALEEAGHADYYGFSLDGDQLYLLDDFTVTHNSGKGYSLGKVPEVLAMKQQSKAVWDSAGDQNATENPWIQAEAEKRGLKVTYAYVHADPEVQWAHPERGVVHRAADPRDGRMVDADVFADSYYHGARNHQEFYEQNKSNPSARFVFLTNGQRIPGIPREAFAFDRDKLAEFARQTARDSDAPPHVKRGATVGERIWGDAPQESYGMAANRLTENRVPVSNMDDLLVIL